MLVEEALAEEGLGPGAKVELATRRGGGNWDPLVLESPHIIGAQLGIDDMQVPLAALEAVPHERREDSLRLIGAIEERAHVAVLVQDASRKRDGLVLIAPAGVHVSLLPSGSCRDGLGWIDNGGCPTQVTLSCPPAPVAARTLPDERPWVLG